MPAWEVSQWMKQMFDLLHEEITDEEVEFYLPQLAGNTATKILCIRSIVL